MYVFVSGREDDRGYFGPWKTCKLLLYNRERCGEGVSRFQATGKLTKLYQLE